MSHHQHIVVLGGGAFGCALTHSLIHQKGIPVVLALRNPDKLYRPELAQHPLCSIVSFADLTSALFMKAICVILAIPCQQLRNACETLIQHFKNYYPDPVEAFLKNVSWVNTAKGIEITSLQQPHQILASVFPGAMTASLSGPSFAEEIFKNLPTCLVLAADSKHQLRLNDVAQCLHSPLLRVYTSLDLVGVEFGGALKNVIAIMAGLTQGLGLGYNALAGLLTRGLWEICKISCHFGAQPQTLMGLSGAGDLMLTCHGPFSRNKHYGVWLAQGSPRSEKSVADLIEGVATAKSVYKILQKNPEIDAPLFTYAYKVLYEDMDIQSVIHDLLNREQKLEFTFSSTV